MKAWFCSWLHLATHLFTQVSGYYWLYRFLQEGVTQSDSHYVTLISEIFMTGIEDVRGALVQYLQLWKCFIISPGPSLTGRSHDHSQNDNYRLLIIPTYLFGQRRPHRVAGRLWRRRTVNWSQNDYDGTWTFLTMGQVDTERNNLSPEQPQLVTM